MSTPAPTLTSPVPLGGPGSGQVLLPQAPLVPLARRGWSLPRLGVAAALATLVLTPLLLILYQSFLSGAFFLPGAHPTLDAFRFIFADDDFYQAGINSLAIAAAERELELMEKRGRATKTKAETNAKYGW